MKINFFNLKFHRDYTRKHIYNLIYACLINKSIVGDANKANLKKLNSLLTKYFHLNDEEKSVVRLDGKYSNIGSIIKSYMVIMSTIR